MRNDLPIIGLALICVKLWNKGTTKRQTLRSKKKKIAKLYEEFDNKLQHDAKEVHEKLLDTLNDQSKSSRSMLRQELISTTFQCQIMETNKCRLCQSEVMTSTDNYSVWLPVPSSNEEISLEQILAEYFYLNPNLEKRCAENECDSETFCRIATVWLQRAARLAGHSQLSRTAVYKNIIVRSILPWTS